MQQIENKLYAVNNKESFINFVNFIATLDKNEWENNNLEKYLKAIGDYTENIDGFYENLSNPVFDDLFKETKESYKNMDIEEVFSKLPPIVWRIFADILMGAINYE